MLNQAAVVTLNHLLVQSGWALPRLVRFSGKTVHVHVAPFTLSCTLQHDGSLQAASATDSADATCTFSPALLPRLALHDESALEQLVTTGDAALITEIVYLIRNLRWDAAEDLSRLVGDVAAERTVQFAQARHDDMRAAALNTAQALSEYWTEERPLLATPRQITAFTKDVQTLQGDVMQLQQRIAHLIRRDIQ